MAGQKNWLERWLARWDARNQRVLDRQAAEHRKDVAETDRQEGRAVRATAPDGTVYRVLAVKAGSPLRGPELDIGGGGDGLELVLLLLVLVGAALVWLVGRLLPRRRGRGWKVGVLRPRRWWAQIVHCERLGLGADEVARVAELARQIEAGTFTSARMARRGASLD